MSDELIFQAAGWAAVALNIAEKSMRTMLPLRLFALATNVGFLVFAAGLGILPTFVLHCILLPLNLWRTLEIIRLTRRIRHLGRANETFEWMRPFMSGRRFEDGAVIFRKGDRPDNLYYLASGRILLEEGGIELEPGAIFGEMAFLTEARERTMTARCIGPCEVLSADEATFLKLFYQNPTFGVQIVRMMSRRLIDGVAQHPGAYRPIGSASDAAR